MRSATEEQANPEGIHGLPDPDCDFIEVLGKA